MENSSKALILVGEVLIGIILLSLISWFFTQIRVAPESQVETQTVEQITSFNNEYEVFDKSIMYGVDLISCLNKAISNNERYPEYYVDVCFKLKNTLTERIEIKAFKQTTSSGTLMEYLITAGEDLNTGKKVTEVFATNGKLTEYKNTDELKSKLIEGNNSGIFKENVVYSLKNNSDNITKLLNHSTNFKPTVANTSNDANAKIYSSTNKSGWSKATWYTFLYDLKTRKFDCTNISYSESTGRVNSISFEEVDD